MKIFCWQFVIFSLLWFSPDGNMETSSPCSGKKVNIKALKSSWNSNSNLWNQNSHEFVKSEFSGFQISNPSLLRRCRRRYPPESYSNCGASDHGRRASNRLKIILFSCFCFVCTPKHCDYGMVGWSAVRMICCVSMSRVCWFCNFCIRFCWSRRWMNLAWEQDEGECV